LSFWGRHDLHLNIWLQRSTEIRIAAKCRSWRSAENMPLLTVQRDCLYLMRLKRSFCGINLSGKIERNFIMAQNDKKTCNRDTSGTIHLWTPEVFACCTSILSLFALIALVTVCDEKAIFDWHGITLNTVIAILTGTGKASLLFAMEAVTGQWKWISFCNSDQLLINFEWLDNASRGPWGNLQMIWQWKRMYVCHPLYPLHAKFIVVGLVKLYSDCEQVDEYILAALL
jgi:hypothetical protein